MRRRFLIGLGVVLLILALLALIFLLILYNFSSGLALYMTTQNLLTIAQTKLTPPVVTTAPAPSLTPPPKKKK